MLCVGANFTTLHLRIHSPMTTYFLLLTLSTGLYFDFLEKLIFLFSNGHAYTAVCKVLHKLKMKHQ